MALTMKQKAEAAGAVIEALARLGVEVEFVWMSTYLDYPEIQLHYKSTIDQVQAILRRFEGKVEKRLASGQFNMEGHILGHQVRIAVRRSLVCTPREVTKTLPAEPSKPEREITVVEWDCPDSILKKESEATSG